MRLNGKIIKKTGHAWKARTTLIRILNTRITLLFSKFIKHVLMEFHV
jgi:hypothetical protein